MKRFWLGSDAVVVKQRRPDHVDLEPEVQKQLELLHIEAPEDSHDVTDAMLRDLQLDPN